MNTKTRNKTIVALAVLLMAVAGMMVMMPSEESDAATIDIYWTKAELEHLDTHIVDRTVDIWSGDKITIFEIWDEPAHIPGGGHHDQSVYVVNPPSWLIQTTSGSNGFKIWATTEAPIGTNTINLKYERNFYSLFGLTGESHEIKDFKLTINVKGTINFEYGDGTGNQTSLVADGNVIILPSATKSGSSFNGWFDSVGNKIGDAGSSYYPTAGITLYAHYSANAIQFLIANKTTSATSYTVPYNGYISLQFQTDPSNSTVTLSTNPIGGNFPIIKSGNNFTLAGNVSNVLPGTYHMILTAKCTGYSDATLTVQVNVATAIIEPLTDTIYVNQTWYHQITTIPATAKIQPDLTTVKNGQGTTVSNLNYSLYISDRSFNVGFSVEGTYYINLVVSAPGYSPATKQIILHVIPNETISGSPFASGITAIPNDEVDGGFYFTVNDPRNYHYLRWDYGDGTSPASERSVTHKYDRNGQFQATCTLFNTSTGEEYTVSVTVIVTLNQQIGTDAWVGVSYSYAVEISSTGNATMTTDIDQSWLSIRTFEKDGKKYVELYSDTGPFPDLLNSDLTVNIAVDGIPFMTLTIHIWPAIDENTIGTGVGSITLSADGYEVTLFNTGSVSASYIQVTWGDGRTSRMNMISGTHTYAVAGTYSVKADYMGNGGSIASAFSSIRVPSTTATHTVIYNGNGAPGSMPNSSGHSISVAQNTFVRDGYSFLYWNTSGDGSGTTFVPGALLNDLNADLELFAIWKNLNGNGNDNDDEDESFLDKIISVLNTKIGGIPLWAIIIAIIVIVAVIVYIFKE
jgi:Listeria-Bacteroides repeat domain (List_Bact_rpt).